MGLAGQYEGTHIHVGGQLVLLVLVATAIVITVVGFGGCCGGQGHEQQCVLLLGNHGPATALHTIAAAIKR